MVARPNLRSYDIPIERDAVVALYTDGLIEFARDMEAAETHLAKLVAGLVGNTSTRRPAQEIRGALLRDTPPSGDLALMIVQFSDASGVTDRAEAPRADLKTWRFHSSDALTTQAYRREVVHFLRRDDGDESERFDSELIIGELLANAVEHAPGIIDVTIDWAGEFPLVTVVDRGTGYVDRPARLPEDTMDESGRGLYLVRALSKHTTIRGVPGEGTEMA